MSITNGTNKSNGTNGTNGAAADAFTPIAICGMACRLPGNVHSPEDLWEFLMSKGDARGLVPDSRYSIAGHYSTSGKPATTNTEHGYFLDPTIDLGSLDTSFFPLGRKELEGLDPQQRIFLEVARESLDDAGEVGWKGKNVGVYIGSFTNDWYDICNADTQKTKYVASTHDFALSNRVSYEMDLRGPSVTIRTACSSSLIALGDACASIAKGECTSAIVGGTNLLLAPSLTTAISEQGALSPDGSCKTFSSAANGYARGEGIVAIFVKKLSDAQRDGNPIRGVIVGTGTNADGKTPGFSVPNSVAQEELIRSTYQLAGISESEMAQTGYFECHGTGTTVGDTIETSAISRVFGNSGGIHIGSVKPNLGHGEGASGLTGLLKAVLALEHRTIPPTIKCMPLNPKIPFETNGLKVVAEATPWPEDRYERVSVNCFGIGGSNAHVIVDSAARYLSPPTAATAESDGSKPQLLLFSANTQNSLQLMTKAWSEYLEKNLENVSLSRIAYTLAMRREQLPFRSFSVVTKNACTITSASATAASPPKASNLVMVFTGQGSQWPQMGRELLQTNAVFKESVQLLDNYLSALGADTPDWKIEDELLKPSRTSRVNDAEFSQPLCTAIQVALVDTLASVGIRPQAVVGHSSGEIGAAYAAGGLTAKDAIIIAFYRGLASKRQTRVGAMAAVSMSWESVQKHLRPGVVVACENSPESITLSGDAEQIKLVVADLKKTYPTILASVLKVNKAYHSDHMVEIGEEYFRMMKDAGVVGAKPSVPFFSSVTGDLLADGKHDIETDALGPRYWQKNLESPVLFKDAVSKIFHTEVLPFPAHQSVFLEVGAHAALSGPLRQILIRESISAPHIATLTRHQDGLQTFLTAIGKLWGLNFKVDFSPLLTSGISLPDLPRYPWNHRRSYWSESRIAKEWRFREFPHHDLLGVRVLESSALEPAWRNLVHLDSVPWLRDHKIREDNIFPFAGYIAIAGEAIRQLTNIQEGFELKNVIVTTSLVLPEGSPTEILTSFHRHRYSDNVESEWWDFTIMSYNGYVWVKHCVGKVRARKQLPSRIQEAPSYDTLPHKVNMRQWYERMARAGMNYGPEFRTLQQTSTTSNGSSMAANGKLRSDILRNDADYHVHPVVIDTFFQLAGAAYNHGLTHDYKQIIPLSVEYIAIQRCSADSIEIGAAGEQLGGSINSVGTLTADSEVFATVSGAILGPLDAADDTSDSSPIPPLARSEWVPHIDFSDFSNLVKSSHDHSLYLPTLESLTQLAVVLSQRALMNAEGEDVSPSKQNFRKWLSRLSFPALEGLSTDELKARVDSLCTSLAGTPAAPAAIVIANTLTDLDLILSGRASSFESIHSQEVVSNVYEFLSGQDLSGFFHCLGYSKPNLKILELSTGSGATRPGSWDNFKRKDGQVLYSRYVYAQPLPEFTDTTKEIYGKEQPNLEFVTFSISENPQEQGLDDSFDLIIANNTIHSTSSLGTSLRHVRSLLAPDGRLLLHQPRVDLLWTKYVFGSFPAWWVGENDERPEGPYVDTQRWIDELVSAGFNGLAGVVPDSPTPSHLSTAMLAGGPRIAPITSEGITLLHNADEVNTIKPLASRLEEAGFSVTWVTVNDTLPKDQNVISVLEVNRPFFSTLDEEKLENLKSWLAQLNDSAAGIFWVIPSLQSEKPDPTFAPIVGFSRTIRGELGVDIATCEVSDFTSDIELASIVKTVRVFHDRYTENTENSLDPDFEYAISGDVIRVMRIFPYVAEESSVTPVTSQEVYFGMKEVGRLDSLCWFPYQATPPKDDEIQVEVHASGVNLRDILTAMGQIAFRGERPLLGFEAAGIVRQIGSNVSKFRPGDRVVFMADQTFSTVVTQKEDLCQAIPDNMSFAEAASMPVVYMTAIHSLITTARLEKGQSVLIHSGCGGVGIASIQIATMLGAKIYTTVGSEEKVNYLTTNFGIPRNQIFNSRNTSFVDDLMRETGGRGVDVALNALSGELLHSTWRCIAKFGIMVEIGKIDVAGRGQLDMDVFLENRTYACVDILSLGYERPQVTSRLLQSMIDYYQQGYIKPLPLAGVFPAGDATAAFRYMQQGTHIGKIIITIRDSGNLTIGAEHIVAAQNKSNTFEAEASYLIVGGLGGLGRSVAIWMAQRGAQNIIILSRRDTKGQHEQDFIRLLGSLGCTLTLVQGSVTDLDDVVKSLKATTKPVRGIIQMTMVLRDQSFPKMTIEDWNEATAPKVQGTWNLHNAANSLNLDLKFFILISSLSGVIGQTGQANYAAANTFLDTFARYRNAMGLPCTAIDVGAVEGVGYLSENSELLRKMRGTGWRLITEEALLGTVATTLQESISGEEKSKHVNGVTQSSWSDIVVDENRIMLGMTPEIPLSSPDASSRLRKDARMAVYHNTKQGRSDAGENGGNTLRAFLSQVKTDSTILKQSTAATTLANEIGKKLFTLLLKPEQEPDITLGLSEVGLDSMIAVEMRAWWKLEFGFNISVLEMLATGTLAALGEKAVKGLTEIYDG
ncbi:hypothetical protein NUW58_g1155 [Xylaria curta]|uniref:Uncharacterized protein n=1 Tax=Xylaria curta TaxID=42375 RepID=A0ACC1PNB3_9PEZI|nr:hypothetical protein NUW58_g1155 [Xylaria curta]